MSLSPKVKLALKVLLAAYAALVIAFVVTAMRRKPHPQRGQIVKGFIQVAKAHKAELAERDAEAMYDHYVAKKGSVFGLNYTALMQILNFAILFLLLYGFLWNPMMEFLDKRREEIRSDIDSARQSDQEAKKLLAEYEKKLQDARAERQTMIEDGQAQGHRERDAIVEQAHQQAARVLETSRQELAAEVAKAREELRKEVGALSIQVATHILEREVKPADHEEMIGHLVEDISSTDLKV